MGLLATMDERTMAIQWGVVIGASLVAAAFDLRTRRIPNALTAPLFAVGLIGAAGKAGLPGFIEAVGAAALMALPYLFLFVLCHGGAGDAKLMAAIGAWLGLRQGLIALFCVAAAGILLAIVKAIAQRRLLSVLGNIFISVYSVFIYIHGFVFAGREPREDRDGRRGVELCQSLTITIPYGVAIFAGVCAAGGVVMLW